jgi:outer membrane murein-binding lipoprotein Lpp
LITKLEKLSTTLRLAEAKQASLMNKIEDAAPQVSVAT